MRTTLIILGIWLLLNILFVVIVIPARKPKKQIGPGSLLAPVTIEQRPVASDHEEKIPISLVIMSLGIGVLLVFSPPIIKVMDDIKRIFRKQPSSE